MFTEAGSKPKRDDLLRTLAGLYHRLAESETAEEVSAVAREITCLCGHLHLHARDIQEQREMAVVVSIWSGHTTSGHTG